MIEIPQNIKHALREVGFDMAQTQTVFYLFQSGVSSIADIALGTGLPRSTIHLAVEELIERGVLGTTISGKRRMVYIENPEKIKKFVEHEEIVTRTKMGQLELLLPQLRSFFTLRGDSEKIDIEHLEGEDGFVKVFYKSLEQPKGGTVSRFGGDPEKFTVARDRLKNYRELRIKHKIGARILLPESPVTEEEKREALSKFREVRSLPRDQYNPNLQISIWNNSVAITIWDQGLHSIVITNKSIYEFMKMMFEMAWNQAK